MESVELTVDGELNDEWHDEGDEEPGDGLNVFDGGDWAVPFIEIRCVNNLLRHNVACYGGPEMGLLGGSHGLLEWGLVYGHLWWVILSNLLEGWWG